MKDITNDIDLSIIIPVYNIEEYLSQCLTSALKQKGINLEFILINDGSTDNSGKVAEIFKEADNRIIVVHQENRGLSKARNKGIALARGKYLLFLDSDDWLEPDSLFDLYSIAVKYDLDMLKGIVKKISSEDDSYIGMDRATTECLNQIFTGKSFFSSLVRSGNYVPTVYNYIYKSQFVKLNKLRFSNMIHEDEVWTPITLYYAKRVMAVDLLFYNYRQNRNGSIMSSLSSKRINAYIEVTNLLVNFMLRIDNNEYFHCLFAVICRIYMWCFNMLSSRKDLLYILPCHSFYYLHFILKQTDPELLIINNYSINASIKALKYYLKWQSYLRLEKNIIGATDKLILVFNTPDRMPSEIKWDKIFTSYCITSNRKFLKSAKIVLFYLPTLVIETESDLEKADFQEWILYDYIHFVKYSKISSDIMELFDAYIEFDVNNEFVEIQEI